MADFLFDEGKNKIEGLKKTEINQALESKADAQAVANAFQSVNTALNGKASTQALNQAVQDINTALNGKANAQAVASAFESVNNALDSKAVANWYSEEKFDGTFTQWYTDDGKLKQGSSIKSAVIPMKNGRTYKISAKGIFNRFSLDTADIMQINANATRIFFNVNNDIIREYTFQNTDNANYLLITLDVASVDFNCDLSVKEVVFDETNVFTVNGLDVVLTDELSIVSNGNYFKSVEYTDTSLCLDGGKISKQYVGKLAVCPIKNGLKYEVAIKGDINRLSVAVSNSCAIGGSYTTIYSSGIYSLTSVNIKEEYTNSNNYSYLLVYYYL